MNNPEIIVLAFSAFTNIVGIVWAAAKISGRLDEVMKSVDKLWAKFADSEAKLIDLERKVAVLMDRSNRE